LPTKYALHQNYPNPFNPITEFHFDLPENAHVELTIFNTLGQEVAMLVNAERAAGAHAVTWDASSVPSGMYVYQLRAESFVDSKKTMLLK
jgi:hypothetical protein